MHRPNEDLTPAQYRTQPFNQYQQQLPSSSNQTPNINHPSHQLLWNHNQPSRTSHSSNMYQPTLNTTPENTRMLFIIHVPVVEGESPRNIVLQICIALGIHLQNSDIQSAHRIKTRPDSNLESPPHICLILADIYTKNLIYQAARNQRPSLSCLSLNTNILSNPPAITTLVPFTQDQLDKPVFINEHLSPTIRSLQSQARALRTRHPAPNIRHYTADGVLWIRLTAGTDPIPISTQEEFDSLFNKPLTNPQ
jgi:hypothetical protein